MTTRSNARKQFLLDVFTTALEGGIGYWSYATEYHWSLEGGGDDLDGFYAVVHDNEDDDADSTLRIDADVIARGVNRIAKARVFYEANAEREEDRHSHDADVKYLSKYVHDIVVAASFANDAAPDDGPGDVDAGVADDIVQVGLFGEVRYG